LLKPHHQNALPRCVVCHCVMSLCSYTVILLVECAGYSAIVAPSSSYNLPSLTTNIPPSTTRQINIYRLPHRLSPFYLFFLNQQPSFLSSQFSIFVSPVSFLAGRTPHSTSESDANKGNCPPLHLLKYVVFSHT